MNIFLTPELEELVKQKVESGLYNSATEVIHEALWLLDERDRLGEMKLEALRKDIQKGIDSIERGEYTVYDENTLADFFEGIKAEGRKRLGLKLQSDG